jgi:hypothetical protein
MTKWVLILHLGVAIPEAPTGEVRQPWFKTHAQCTAAANVWRQDGYVATCERAGK